MCTTWSRVAHSAMYVCIAGHGAAACTRGSGSHCAATVCSCARHSCVTSYVNMHDVRTRHRACEGTRKSLKAPASVGYPNPLWYNTCLPNHPAMRCRFELWLKGTQGVVCISTNVGARPEPHPSRSRDDVDSCVCMARVIHMRTCIATGHRGSTHRRGTSGLAPSASASAGRTCRTA